MSAAAHPTATPASTGRQAPFRTSTPFRLAMAALFAYALYAASQLNFSWSRLMAGADNAQRFLGRMFPPNFSQAEVLLTGFAESMQIAVLAKT